MISYLRLSSCPLLAAAVLHVCRTYLLLWMQGEKMCLHLYTHTHKHTHSYTHLNAKFRLEQQYWRSLWVFLGLDMDG